MTEFFNKFTVRFNGYGFFVSISARRDFAGTYTLLLSSKVVLASDLVREQDATPFEVELKLTYETRGQRDTDFDLIAYSEEAHMRELATRALFAPVEKHFLNFRTFKADKSKECRMREYVVNRG